MKTLLIINLFWGCLAADGSQLQGVLQNKFGDLVGNANLTATNAVTQEAIPFIADRAGEFNIELPPGDWTIQADIQQIAVWGYAQLENVAVAIVAGQNTTQNITLFARIPLEAPTVTISVSSPGVYRFQMRGQGGTRFRLYRSTDLKTWNQIFSRTMAKEGLDFTTNFAPEPAHAYFKMGATLD